MIEKIEQSGFDLTDTLDLNYLKENGITFTPFSTIDYMYQILDQQNLDYLNLKILEPSLGSGNFILFLEKETTINEFNFISNKIGNKIEIHSNKFSRINVSELEKFKFMKKK